jgi:hypothetical protein
LRKSGEGKPPYRYAIKSQIKSYKTRSTKERKKEDERKRIKGKDNHYRRKELNESGYKIRH